MKQQMLRWRWAVLPLIAFWVGIGSSAKATMIDATFLWTGDQGYHVRTEFRYDDSYAIVGGYNAATPTVVGIDSLEVFVYTPQGQFIDYSRDVHNGQVEYAYFSFYFNTATRDFAPGFMDIGWSFPFYLTGQFGTDPRATVLGLSYFDDDSWTETIDRGGGYSLFFGADAPPPPVEVADAGAPSVTLLAIGSAAIGLFSSLAAARSGAFSRSKTGV